jgi:GNAT superfamily N-acetyltransferase
MSMNIVVEPLLEEELDKSIQIYWDAFEPPEMDMILPMIYPHGLQPDLRSRLRARMLRNTNGDLGSHCFSAKDVSTGEILGISWWDRILQPAASQDEIVKGFEEAYASRNLGKLVAGFQSELDYAFFKAAYFSEAEVVDGMPYMSLRLLATDPRHQRRGVGSTLLRHGLERADRLSLPTYLDSGISGRPLYEKFGFEVKRDFPLDCTEYGGRSGGTHWCMLRPAKSVATT